jgi:hypothetical protein
MLMCNATPGLSENPRAKAAIVTSVACAIGLATAVTGGDSAHNMP